MNRNFCKFIKFANMEQPKKYLQFHNGSKMPIVGLGTWLVENSEEAEASLVKALEIGYRHFDTATKYQNEEVLGRAVQKWLHSGKGKREDLFIVTKLPWIAMRPERVEQFMNRSLKKLQVDYVDLYIVHWPFGMTYMGEDIVSPMKDGELYLDLQSDLLGVWKAMEQQVDAGKARSIGISNFNPGQIKRIMDIAKISPANLQVEAHVYFQQRELRKVCKEHNITIVAYGPLGSPGRYALNPQDNSKRRIPALMEDPVVQDIAKKYAKTPAQILLRFLTQLEIGVIPKSTNPKRLAENLDIFDFEISLEDLKRLEELDKGDDGRSFQEFPSARIHPECPF